jgi:hypothetical protein
MKTGKYAVNLALETTKLTPDMMRVQYKKVKVDRWRKLLKYLGRATSGRNDGTTRYDVPKGKWLKWRQVGA